MTKLKIVPTNKIGLALKIRKKYRKNKSRTDVL